MKLLKKAISLLLIFTIIFSVNIVSLSYPEIKSIFDDWLITRSYAAGVDDFIEGFAPAGTQDLAVKAAVTASSTYNSAEGKWHLDRINDGTFTFNGATAGFSTATDEVEYNDSMTQEQKDAAVAESKNKEFTMTFDLEGYYNISRVVLFRHGAFPDTFEIQVSEDGESYRTVYSASGHAGYGQETFTMDFAVTRARFVRFYVTKRGNLDGNNTHFVQLKEIGIYGAPAAPTNSNIDLDSYAPEHCLNLAPESQLTATENFEPAETWGIRYLNDGYAGHGTGYTSTAQNNYPFYFDYSLGGVTEVKRVVLFPYGEFPAAFEVQTSTDGKNFTMIKSVSGYTTKQSTPVVIDLGENVFATHVRINVTERGHAIHNGKDDVYYVQLAEIGVYGIKNVFDADLTKSSVNLLLNDTLTLEWQTKKQNIYFGYDHKIEWKSNDPAIATVDKNTGLVTGKSIGKTKIIATNTTIGYSAEVDVNVWEKLPYKRDNITISVFSPPTGKLFTNKHYATVAAADVDLLINSYNVTSVEDNLKMLELARNNGMNSIVADSRFWNVKENISKELAEEVYQDYKGISNLEGVYLFDEPWNGNIYAQSAKNLAEVMPGSFVYLNFFPGYIYKSYEQYEYTYDDLAALTEGKVDLMFDVYPFKADGSTDYQILFDSLEAIRQSGLKYNQNTAACMQTHGYGPANDKPSHRDPSYTDMHYQGMVYLAYGIKHLSYWKYSSSASVGTEQHNQGAIDLDGNTTPVYDRMKAVNPIIHTVGAEIYNCDAKEVYISGPNTYGHAAVPSGFFAQPGNSNQSLLLSYLKDKDTGRNYLMVVNNDLVNPVTAPINFASGIGSVELLDNDTGTWTKSTVRGTYNVTLNAGGAALIRLPENYRYGENNEVEGANVFYHKTVYGDSSIGTPGTRDDKLPGWYLSCLTDGYIEANPSKGLNGWCSELKDSSYQTYVQIDLGKATSLDSITLHAADLSTGYDAYFPKSYKILGSSNGSTWTELASATNSQTRDYVTHAFNSTSVRYVKVEITEMNAINGKYAAALGEIETNGDPKILRYTVVPDTKDGFYAYMYCLNAATAKFPSWTDNNGQDDLVWHEGERGNWTIDGARYNYRAYIPVSQHKNERGKYTVHMYAYNLQNKEVAVGTTYEFGAYVLFDLNYGDIAPNIISGINLKSGNGVTATYNASDETITLNGTLQADIEIQPLTQLNSKIKKGDTVRLSVERISGSANATFVVELHDNNYGNPGGTRMNADFKDSGTKSFYISSDAMASDIYGYRLWLFKPGNNTSFNNFKIKIKIEVVKGSDVVMSPFAKTIGYDVAYGTLVTPTRSGATFEGWYTEPAGGSKITSSTKNYDVGNKTLYARWILPPINIYYDMNKPAGTESVPPAAPGYQNISCNTPHTLSTNNPRMDGYTFEGWALTKEPVSGERIYKRAETLTAVEVNRLFEKAQNGSLTLYARWTPVTYTVIFLGNGNDVENEVPAQQYVYDKEYTIPKNTYVRTGYKFVGWTTVSDGTGTLYADQATVKNLAIEAKDVNLYAKWEVCEYEIAFVGNGATGGSMSNIMLTYGEYKNLPANKYTRTGYMFIGWNTKNDGTGTPYDDGASVKNLSQSGVANLYAQWTPCPEVIFGNDFDFDKLLVKQINDITVDKSENSITIAITNENDGELYTSAVGPINLTPGHTYEISYRYTQVDQTSSPQFHYWSYENADGSGANVYNHGRGTRNGEIWTDYITADPVKHYIKIRFDTDKTGSSKTAVGKYRDICIRDITNFADNPTRDNVSKANPARVSISEGNTTVTNFPTLTRTGYTFLGWSTTKDDTTGNGRIEDKKTSYTFTKDEIKNGNNRVLYPIWAPNLIKVTYKTGNMFGTSGREQNFQFGIGAYLDSAETMGLSTKKKTVRFYDRTDLLSESSVTFDFAGWNNALDGTGAYTYADREFVTNPNDIFGNSNEVAQTTSLYAQWKNTNNSTVNTIFAERTGYVLKGWALSTDRNTVVYDIDEAVDLSSDTISLYAVWHEVQSTENVIDQYKTEYKAELPVVSGIVIGADGIEKATAIDDETIQKYDSSDFDDAFADYNSAKTAFGSKKDKATNNNYLDAIETIENIGSPTQENDADTSYLESFTISYADGVEQGPVKAGKYEIKDMELNHYSLDALDDVADALNQVTAPAKTSQQETINRSVITIAKAYANKEDVKQTAPTFNVYETAAKINDSKLLETETVDAINYVYTGKDNYTYYCYTNSKKPTILLSVDDIAGSENRTCYPTTANVIATETTLDAVTGSTVLKRTADNATDYTKYLEAGIGTGKTEKNPNYYKTKDVIQLTPDFTNADDKATVSYTIKAYDDAFAGTDGADKNYASTSKLATTSKEVSLASDSKTPEITIIIDYHKGNVDVTGLQTDTDKWLKKYHLTRTSGGANNWEFGKVNDSVYALDDPIYGPTNFGSFTFTFKVGAKTDIANCILESSDITKVREIVAENYTQMSEVAFDGAQEIWQWKTDPADGVWKYMCTHKAGTGLGYKEWPSGWSFNYYPASQAYTYVHIVDRWGNVVDKIIEVPNLDGSATQLHTNSVGAVDVIELGGSGLESMSFSAETFDIITDENSTFDGETYTTTGNTIKVYTGAANKTYTLEVNDVAANNTTADVTTNADGYLTITVEDEAFDKDSGMYTFSLNGTQINLYGEVETVPERGVTNVEYTPSVDTRNEFMFTVIGRPDKIQVIEPDGGTRTYDRYHSKVTIASYDAEGNVVGAMSRELSYEVWTIEMNVPAEIELTAIARYGREWSKEAPYKYTVILAEPIFDDEVYSMSLERTEGKQGKVLATIVTGLDVQGVRFLMDNNTTTTYYLATEADGKLTYVGNAWINHSGENIIKVKIRVNNKWIDAGELDYNAF